MNAEEAKRKSIENAQWQVDHITSLIETSVARGYLSVYYDMPLSDVTENYLRDLGYTITILDDYEKYKKWQVKISWE